MMSIAVMKSNKSDENLFFLIFNKQEKWKFHESIIFKEKVKFELGVWEDAKARPLLMHQIQKIMTYFRGR